MVLLESQIKLKAKDSHCKPGRAARNNARRARAGQQMDCKQK